MGVFKNLRATGRGVCGLFSLLIVIFGSSCPGAVPLVEDGAPKARIYVDPADFPASAKPNPNKEAVEDLNYHLEKMTGTRLEVVETSEPGKIQAPAIVLGSLAAKKGCVPPETRWQECFRVLVKDGLVLINGETPAATTYGIYTFLGNLGCDWVVPGPVGEIIPSRKTVTVEDGDMAVEPSFPARRMYNAGGRPNIGETPAKEFAVWQRRQRLGFSPLLEHTGEGHYWERLIAKYKDEFAANPDMFALVEGPDGELVRKKSAQVETTNPKVIDLIVRDIDRIFKEKGWPHDKAVTLPIGPGDGGGYSLSPESQLIKSGRKDPMLGGDDVTDLVIKLANDVLERVGDKYPNLSLGYYIYSVHAEYPAKFAPNPRIYPIFAPITYSRLQSTTDPGSKSRSYYRSVVDRWSALSQKQGNRLMVYEYNYNLADTLIPFTRVKMFGEDLPFYHKHGIVGFSIECVRSFGITAPHDYIFVKMAWNVDLDWKALLHEFCAKAYGPAAPMLERYYLRMAETQEAAGQEAGSFFAIPLVFDEAFMQAARKDLEEAAAQPLDDRQKELVQAATLPFHALELFLKWNHSIENFDFAAAKAAYDGMLENWQQQIDLNPQYATFSVPRFLKALLLDTTEQGLKYSTPPYEIVLRLPEELPTAFDPTDSGERMNLFHPAVNDSRWVKTSTYRSTWDAQGIFHRNSVWYRHRFQLPENARNKPIGLFLGGFEDVAKVWLNGHYVGTSKTSFAVPAVFDLTKSIKPEGENVLAIQIQRKFNMWEIGTGGLFRPSFLFTGPQVVTEEAAAPEERILPGGIREPVQK